MLTRSVSTGRHARLISIVTTRANLSSCYFKSQEATDESVNAFVSFAPNHSVPREGPLADASIAVKDNICTLSLPTTCSSVMLKDFHPNYNATVINLLEQSGAHIVGKTNCDEFGMGSLNVHSYFGPVVNPFQSESDYSPWGQREQRSAGGSSGGSAAAVASRQCFAALSTDTGGSTRLPASYCGVVGLKPSYGLLSRWGVISFADSLDTVGIIASRVRDVGRVFDVVSHYDYKDPTSIPHDLRNEAQTACHHHVEKYIPQLHGSASLQGLRVGIPQEYFPAELDPSLLQPFRKTLAHLKDRGAALIPVSLPSTPYALSAYYVIASAEASSNMARYDGVRYGAHVPPSTGTDTTRTANVYAHSRTHGFGNEVQKRILLGTYALTAEAYDNYFLQAQWLRTLIRADFDCVFRVSNVLSSGSPSARHSPSRTPPSTQSSDSVGVDVLLHPSSIRTAPPLSARPSQGIEGLDTYLQDVLTVPASLAGLPALNVPAGRAADGWPVGVSVVGQWGCEEVVMQVGEVVERSWLST
ncbi:amidase signature enzyme [Gautieria morchelliformis]|nr:amidase signature enzyme [Gautieria morchelliformis]